MLEGSCTLSIHSQPKRKIPLWFLFYKWVSETQGGQSNRAGNDRAQPFSLCVSFSSHQLVQKTFIIGTLLDSITHETKLFPCFSLSIPCPMTAWGLKSLLVVAQLASVWFFDVCVMNIWTNDMIQWLTRGLAELFYGMPHSIPLGVCFSGRGSEIAGEQWFHGNNKIFCVKCIHDYIHFSVIHDSKH